MGDGDKLDDCDAATSTKIMADIKTVCPAVAAQLPARNHHHTTCVLVAAGRAGCVCVDPAGNDFLMVPAEAETTTPPQLEKGARERSWRQRFSGLGLARDAIGDR